jgi:hypothetical protein
MPKALARVVLPVALVLLVATPFLGVTHRLVGLPFFIFAVVILAGLVLSARALVAAPKR